MSAINLHELTINVDGGKSLLLKNHSVKLKSPLFDKVEVIFKDHEQRVLELIDHYKDGAIFGCVAWLTSTAVLKKLAQCETVQIIVQKEDFLRPDIGNESNNRWKTELRNLYAAVTCKLERHQFNAPIGDLSVCSDPTVDGIRCVGNHNSEQVAAFPRSHHKFLVFCELGSDESYRPVGLWTGSFNMTKNATYSFENVIYFEDRSGKNEVMNAFLNEHHQLFALSEPLNWSEKWCAPEFRIGT